MSKYIKVDEIPSLFNEEYKRTKKLIEQGETHLDNLAEGFLEAKQVISQIPTADVIEVKHGEWIECCPLNEFNVMLDENTYFICSECEANIRQKYNFCPHCGADMREKKGDD